MMLPSVALVGLGRGRCTVPLPVPVILLWPLVGLALGVAALVEACHGAASPRRSGFVPLTRTLARALCQLSGVKVDVRGAEGGRVYLWLV